MCCICADRSGRREDPGELWLNESSDDFIREENEEYEEIQEADCRQESYERYLEYRIGEDVAGKCIMHKNGQDFVSGDGIVGTDIEQTIANVGKLGKEGMIINGLPSKELGKGGSLWKKINKMMPESGNVFRKGTDKYWMNKYIMGTFKNAQDNSGSRDTFFNYEAEYILEGHYSDEKNRKAFKRELMTFTAGRIIIANRPRICRRCGNTDVELNPLMLYNDKISCQ